MKTTIGRVGAATAAVATALGLLVAAPFAALAAQDTPSVVKDKLPAKAVCFICSNNGESHGEEKPAAAVAYKGKTYFFCSKKEAEAFVKEPEDYIPAPLPRPAPAFTLKTVGGQAATLRQLSQGRVLLVDFWATWCGPCIKAMPDLQKLHDQYDGKGFSVVGVSIDEKGAQTVQPFLAKQRTKYTYPILLDTGDTWTRWGVKALPGMFLVKDGQIVRQWTGKIDKKEVESAVAQALGA